MFYGATLSLLEVLKDVFFFFQSVSIKPLFSALLCSIVLFFTIILINNPLKF